MSTETVTGEISQKLNFESCVEWTIEDIFSYIVEDERYQSPTFCIAGSGWYLRMYPNGKTEDESVGWIDLYLMRESSGWAPPMSVNYDLGVKKADGEVEVKTKDASQVFDKGTGWGRPKFLQRSQLLERKSELAPSLALTVTCTMRVNDVLDSTLSLIELSNDFKNMLISKEGCDATLKVHVGDVCGLYKIAHKYCVENLKSTCVNCMVTTLSVDNVLDFFCLGHYFDEPELKRKSQEFFGQHFARVVLTDKWESLFKENPSLANELITNMAKGIISKS